MNKYRFAVLGLGNMGKAFFEGVINANIFSKEQLLCYTLEEDIRAEYINRGIAVSNDDISLLTSADIVLLAIKPQSYDEILTKIKDHDFSNKVIMSLAPGKTIDYLKSYFHNATIIRLMPNLAAKIAKASITVYSDNLTNNNIYYKDIDNILNSVGQYVMVQQEMMIDYALPLNGSMPAFIYAFVKEFIVSAKKYGISDEDAKKLILSAIDGSLSLYQNSNENIDTLISRVCSKGGTTLAGLDGLYQSNFAEAIKNCYDKCVNRSIELGKK